MTLLQLKPSPVHYPAAHRQTTFRLFDLSLTTDFSFQTSLPPASAAADLHFTCRPEPPVAVKWEAVKPLFTSREQTSDGVSLFLLFAAKNTIMLRFTRIADFYLWSDMIVCHLHDPDCAYLVEIYFLGMIMACWFELQGIPAIHAAASVVNGQAVAFLSSNQGGKTSLAAAFMQQGCPLLTDDILLIEPQNGQAVGRSGYPQLRLWPQQAETLFGSHQEFLPIHPHLDKRRVPIDFKNENLFRSGRFPLGRCYIPERYPPDSGQTAITITPLSPVEAMLKLAGYSFLYWLVETIGLQPQRLKILSQIVQSVPVCQLKYPSGVEHLPAVCRAILTDLQ